MTAKNASIKSAEDPWTLEQALPRPMLTIVLQQQLLCVCKARRNSDDTDEYGGQLECCASADLVLWVKPLPCG